VPSLQKRTLLDCFLAILPTEKLSKRTSKIYKFTKCFSMQPYPTLPTADLFVVDLLHLFTPFFEIFTNPYYLLLINKVIHSKAIR